MKQFFKIQWFHIKTNKYIILYSLIFIYLVIVPLLLSLNIETETGIWLCCDYLQKLLLIPCLFLLIQLFKPYIEIEYKDMIHSINKSFKYLYVIFDYLFIQILLFPLYGILINKNASITEFLICFAFQQFIFMTITYIISLICSSSIVTLGIIVIYILLFSFPLSDITLGNLMLKSPYLEQDYILLGCFICFVSMVLGYTIENYIYKYFL